MDYWQAWVSVPHPDHGMIAPYWTRVGPLASTPIGARLNAERAADTYFPREDQAARKAAFLSRVTIRAHRPGRRHDPETMDR